MIALVGIISTSVMLHNYHFFLIFAIVRYQSPSQFDDENRVLLSVFSAVY